MATRLLQAAFAQRKAVLTITKSAASRLQQLLVQQQRSDIIGIRIGVRRKGCNGLAYTMDYASGKERLDEEVEENGVKVIVESKAVMALLGTEMDFVDNELGSEFVFNNPNAKGTCGCGESFHI